MMVEKNRQADMRSQIDAKEIFEQAKRYAYEYMDDVGARRVFPSDEALASLKVFDEALSDHGAESAEILRLLHEYGAPATVAQTGGRYFGFVCGGAVPAALAAKWLADVWDQNAGLNLMSPIAAKLEAICERWIAELLGLPKETAAGFVSGSSTAALCGVAIGRNELLKRQGWNVNVDGLFGAPTIRVILGRQAHASVFKALSLLGLGSARVEFVPVDAQGRMIASEMPALDERCLVIVQAGNVNTGAFDPIGEICEQARKANAWVHVDGAFGLWAACSKTRNSLTRGIEKADSWSVDAHKTLNSPYDCGIILCRSREAFVAAMQSTASYIHYGENRDGMQYTPEMSRRARAVEIWATLKSLGRDGAAELVDRLCELAALFAERLRTNGFRILNDVVFNQVLVACETPEQTKATLESVQRSGECWCGGTNWNDEPAIRISVCSWATTAEDVERSVAAFVRAKDASKLY